LICCCPNVGIYRIQAGSAPVAACTGRYATFRSSHGKGVDIALLLLLSTPSAFGQYVAVIAACTRDVTKFCHAATPRQNFLAECIESHFQDFHEQCRAALVQTAAVRESLQGGCRAAMSRCAAWSRPHLAVHEKTFRCARSVLQGRDRPRGRAQGRVLLSIGPAGSGYSSLV
jgi:hypothetical protein